MPGDVPTRSMMSMATTPSTKEVTAIQALEMATRNCQKLRAAAGVPTSATEDILTARISKLRYGLYKGKIPYAVYNYGLAQAMRKSNAFMMAGQKAAQKGKQIGDQRFQQDMMQAQMTLQMNSLRSSLNTYNNSMPMMPRTWYCQGPTCF